jgi:hypothetical protein
MDAIMRCDLLVASIGLLVGCGLARDSWKDGSSDSSTAVQSSSIHTPTAIKPNMSLIGAVITDIILVDEFNFRIGVELRTAVPDGQFESLAEPGQSLRLVPQFRMSDGGMIDRDDERNKRLLEIRSRGAGDFLFGKITLGQDHVWYLVDTTLY